MLHLVAAQHVVAVPHVVAACPDILSTATAKVDDFWTLLVHVFRVGTAAFLIHTIFFHRTAKRFVPAFLLAAVAWWAVIGGGVGNVGARVENEFAGASSAVTTFMSPPTSTATQASC